MPYSTCRQHFHVDSHAKQQVLRASSQQIERMRQAPAESPPANSSLPPGYPAGSRSASLQASRTPHGSAQQTDVCSSPSARIRSANPSISRSQTSLVASGVTSRAASPVPPVVTIKVRALLHDVATLRQSNPAHRAVSRPSPSPTPAASSNWRTAGPERSTCSPREQRSLIVSTTARISEENLWVTLPVYGFRPTVS